MSVLALLQFHRGYERTAVASFLHRWSLSIAKSFLFQTPSFLLLFCSVLQKGIFFLNFFPFLFPSSHPNRSFLT